MEFLLRPWKVRKAFDQDRLEFSKNTYIFWIKQEVFLQEKHPPSKL